MFPEVVVCKETSAAVAFTVIVEPVICAAPVLLPAVNVEPAVVAKSLLPFAVSAPVPALMELLLVRMPVAQVPAIWMAFVPVPVLFK